MNENMVPKFIPFPKIARLSKVNSCIITEKIDGTNASIMITEDGGFFAGSRNRWVTVEDDNYGFAKWAAENKEELLKLGPGHHFGEWWGLGIGRGYGLKEKRFSLFNTKRWSHPELRPLCCHSVPVLGCTEFSRGAIDVYLDLLSKTGSVASPGFMKPEGICVYHMHANIIFKKTLDNDDEHKGIEK